MVQYINYIDGIKIATARKIADKYFKGYHIKTSLNHRAVRFDVIVSEETPIPMINEFVKDWGHNWRIYKIKKESPQDPRLA